MTQVGARWTDKPDVKIGVRIPATLKALISEFVVQDTHLNESDFIRDAIREKIQREAPELYQSLFRVTGGKRQQNE